MTDTEEPYTRDRAFQDGILVDVSRQAYQVGFLYPVALTDDAWGEIQFDDEKETDNRLWSFLQTARLLARTANPDASYVEIRAYLPRENGDDFQNFVMGIGNDDKDNIVITIWTLEEEAE